MTNHQEKKGFFFTKHAEGRLARRRIPREAVPVVIDYGFVFQAGSHDVAYWLCRRAAAGAGPGASRFENIAVIVADDGVVRTVMRCSRTPNHWKRVA